MLFVIAALVCLGIGATRPDIMGMLKWLFLAVVACISGLAYAFDAIAGIEREMK